MKVTLVVTLALAVLAGFVAHEAEARGRSATRTLRMAAPADATSAAGRMQFRTHRGTTFVSATFSRLAPDTLHTLHWDATGQDGPQFTTDRRGRAKLRHRAVPVDAAAGTPQISVTDENGDEVLACDPDSMPAMHGGSDGSGGHDSHHETDGTGGMMGGSGHSNETSGGMMSGSGTGHSSGSPGGMMGGGSSGGMMHR
jgi:hypothetical protein